MGPGRVRIVFLMGLQKCAHQLDRGGSEGQAMQKGHMLKGGEKLGIIREWPGVGKGETRKIKEA